jgi:hypothetical protein
MSFRSLSFASLAAVALFAGSFTFTSALAVVPDSASAVNTPEGKSQVHDQTRWCNVLLREH